MCVNVLVEALMCDCSHTKAEMVALATPSVTFKSLFQRRLYLLVIPSRLLILTEKPHDQFTVELWALYFSLSSTRCNTHSRCLLYFLMLCSVLVYCFPVYPSPSFYRLSGDGQSVIQVGGCIVAHRCECD